ncbi:uncharacterized protein LOC124153298 [Ischnura elegans]|uniref:uncharacterized protein LOC124153298 n=1 Tax=Ischnura elegans TaxID=197161 RepID=UPI001ED8BE86|nr:uncharacterized protein LOC124153298 [Ischnura elegans]
MDDEDWKKYQAEDMVCQEWKSCESFEEKNGLLFRSTSEGLKVVVPVSRRETVFRQHHDHALSGHLGVKPTIRRIRQMYWWPSLDKDVREMIASCVPCNQRSPYGKTRAPLKKLPSEASWSAVSDHSEDERGDEWKADRPRPLRAEQPLPKRLPYPLRSRRRVADKDKEDPVEIVDTSAATLPVTTLPPTMSPLPFEDSADRAKITQTAAETHLTTMPPEALPSLSANSPEVCPGAYDEQISESVTSGRI